MTTANEMTTVNIPFSLNGYPVVKADTRRGNIFGSNNLIVMVHRKGEPHPYVVATWSPACGNEWVWGTYCKDRDEAERVFREKT